MSAVGVSPPTRSATAGDGLSNRPIRTLVVAGEPDAGGEAELLHALRRDARFDVSVHAGVQPLDKSLAWTERLYRSLDRRLFGRRFRTGTRGGPRASTGTVMSSAFDLVVDLTGGCAESCGASAALTLVVRFEGLAARELATAVRRRLGMPEGVVEATVSERTEQGERPLFGASCFVDHRSLSRSVSLVAGKLPTLITAAQKRSRAGMSTRGVHSAATVATGLPAWRLLVRLGATAFRRLLVNDQWRIVLYRDRTRRQLDEPWVELMPDERRFWADPFVVPHDDGVAVFFEELPFASGKGRISVIDVDHDGKASAPIVVLDEPWHLSYPFVFEHHGRRYMIPESLANETVDLYECVDFPAGWRRVATLIRGKRLADATLIPWNGRLWMFVAHGDVGTTAYDELHVYWADDLLGPWTPHALNPVKIDAGSARPAGAMFIVDGRIVRPTQDCRNRYGDGVCFQEVTTLDECRFEERPLDRLAPGGARQRDGFHTYNGAGRYAVVDAAGWALRRPIGRRAGDEGEAHGAP